MHSVGGKTRGEVSSLLLFWGDYFCLKSVLCVFVYVERGGLERQEILDVASLESKGYR